MNAHTEKRKRWNFLFSGKASKYIWKLHNKLYKDNQSDQKRIRALEDLCATLLYTLQNFEEQVSMLEKRIASMEE